MGSHGYLNIINGGTVQSTRASLAFEEGFATVTVDGADSSWDISDYFLIGGNGAATLNITNGGKVTSAGGVAIANRTGSQGLVTVDGVGSSWTNNGALVIGGRVGDMIDSSGDGFLTIKNGGLISNTDAYLGKYSRGAVTVDGTGSRWNNSGNLVIGDYGTGNLYIQNGGTVSSTNGYLGRSTGTAGRFFYTGSGTATVDGIGSTWNNSGSLYVGGDENTAVGTGVVIASGGGSVNVGNMLKVWKTGSINFSDSTLDTGTLVNLGNINIGSGNTEVHGEVANSGVISVYGNGTATFHDNVWINGYADIHVGNGSSADFLGAVTTGCIFSGTGSLSFQGDLSPSCYKKVDVGGDMTLGIDSRTIMKIAGISQGYGYDSIDVVGNLFLDGELDVVLPNPNFSVSLGDSFDLFVADTINGSFKTLNLSSPGDGLGWQLDILTDAIGTTDIVRLDVVSAVPVPTAIWLFGSGLLGLIVIGRKKKAA